MIKIVGREMHIPKNEENVGFVGDNKVEIREFEIIDNSLFDFDFKLDLMVKSSFGIVDLEKFVESDRIILRWEIKKEHLPEKCMLYAQLRGFSNTEVVWHSDKGNFWVNDCINASDYFPSPLPSEFEQMEQQVTIARNETLAAKYVVLEKADEIVANTQTVANNTSTVVQKSEIVSNSAEEVAQNTQSAINSASIAEQSLADLISMIGTDIATLTNGKLTPSQIPAIAITNTHVVSTEPEMLALIAETGDLCIRNDENKSYILQGTDPTLLSSWLHIKAPANYAENSGHALFADEATNSAMINNHRIVYMTEQQYQNAVKNSDTIYLVGV